MNQPVQPIINREQCKPCCEARHQQASDDRTDTNFQQRPDRITSWITWVYKWLPTGILVALKRSLAPHRTQVYGYDRPPVQGRLCKLEDRAA